jgi:hypothetical protein
MKPFPMPNDSLNGRIVVASCPYIDDERGEIALILLLEQVPPFFTVAHYALADFDPSANPSISPPYGPSYVEGELDVLGRFENIVPAIEEYTQSGGDY